MSEVIRPTESHVDVVIVGGRCAGASAAVHLARTGKRVVVLDKARFPSATLSTHTLQATGVAEIQRLGALDRVLELRPTFNRRMRVEIDMGTDGGTILEETLTPVDGIDYGLSVPRDLLDVILLDTAREAGAEVLEQCTFEDVIRRGGRVVGVTYRDREGGSHRLIAELVVGADGRRSSVAAAVGSWEPYRASDNQRGAAYRYLEDPQAADPDRARSCEGTIYQWRDGTSLAFGFPSTPYGTFLVLFMGDRAEIARARKDPEGYWQGKLAEHPGAAARVRGAVATTPVTTVDDVASYFRAASGPGWVLIGDAGHFKDPSLGQGMRDAFWAGRTMAERAAAAWGLPGTLDLAMRRWEAERDKECLSFYFWGSTESALESTPELYKQVMAARSGRVDPFFSDVPQRLATPQSVITPAVGLKVLMRIGIAGVRRRERVEFLYALGRELAQQGRIAKQLWRGGFRDPTFLQDVERAIEWPEPSAARGRRDAL